MTAEYVLLLSTASSLGALHTAIGVDHTVPFVVLGRARNWTLTRTLVVTACCGFAHVLSSILIGSIGWGIGATAGRLSFIEESRGQLAAWMLIALGTVYAIVGWHRRHHHRHGHVHVHVDGTVHTHNHEHERVKNRVVHHHAHGAKNVAKKTFPFSKRLVPALFLVFLMGPCEALIPLMFAPAMAGDIWLAWGVALAFSATTLTTMLVLVTIGYWGISASKLARFEPHLNWSAGVAIALSGLGIQLLGI